MNAIKWKLPALAVGLALIFTVPVAAAAAPFDGAIQQKLGKAADATNNPIELVRKWRGKHRFGHGGFKHHGFGKHRFRHHRRRHHFPFLAAPFFAAPFFYGGYYDYYYDDGYGGDYCYRECRYYHGPRYCRYYWRRYC